MRGVAAAGVVIFVIAMVVHMGAPTPLSECEYLRYLKREALSCGPQIAAHEGAKTRLACAISRADRIARTGGNSPPLRHRELAAAFASLDAQVHSRKLTPEQATAALERFAGSDTCLTTAATN